MHSTVVNIAALLALLSGAVTVSAQEPDPARDVLIVETLLRLDSFDLEAKPKTKEAVLRYLKANPGNEQFFQLIERFSIKAAGDDLLLLATTKPAETAGVKAAELLVKLDAAKIDQALAGEDATRAAALVQALGTVGGKTVIEKLQPIITDAAKPLAVRSAAVGALGKAKPGVDFLLKTVEAGQLPPDLNFSAANALFASPDPAVKAAAAKFLKLPATADARPLPPLPELAAMKGDAARGRELFATKGTCNKCHIVSGQGKEVGPNLTEIGSKLGKEALLVSILDPSAGISHGFENYLALTADGKVISGILVSKTDAEVVLKDAEAIVHTLKTADLDELKKLPTSLMPADMQKLLTASDLVDVVDYLQTLKKP